MNLSSGKNLKRAAAWMLVTGLVVGAGFTAAGSFTGEARADSQETTVGQDGDNAIPIGVVDFESLIKERPEYARLQEMDEQIAVLERELEFLPLTDQRRRVDSSKKRMQREVDKARKELEGEYARVNQEMAGFQSHMQAQLQQEGAALSSHYQNELQRRIAALQPAAPPPVPQNVQAKMGSYLEDLARVREQRVLSRRLELEKKTQEVLDAEKGRVDNELAAFDTVIMERNQQKRVNLQLALQTASTPEEEESIHKEMDALSDQEGQEKEAKRVELMKVFDAKAAAEKAHLEASISSYEKQLTAETHAKATAERDRLIGKMPAPVNVQSNRAAAQQQIAVIKAQLDQELNARKAQMAATMQAKADEAQARLKTKQANITKRLSNLQKQLQDLVVSQAEDVSPETRKKMDGLQAKIDDLKKQRQELNDSMVADLKSIVAKVAEKQNVPSVVGAYVVNVNCPDLTDLSVVAVKQADH